jgi:hypothetical protein
MGRARVGGETEGPKALIFSKLGKPELQDLYFDVYNEALDWCYVC